jgi:hypothetical protein
VDEIKRAADPRDSGNDMKPAEDGACGFGEYHVHEFPLLSSNCRQNTMAERHLGAQACRAGASSAVFPICRLLLAANLSDDGS